MRKKRSVLENEHLENMENITRSVKPVLNFIKFLKAFCNADFARKSFNMVHKTLSILV